MAITVKQYAVRDRYMPTSEDNKVMFLRRIEWDGLQVWAWDYAVSNGWITQDQRLVDIPAAKIPKRPVVDAIHADLVLTAHCEIPEALQIAYDNAHACDQIPGAEIIAGAVTAGKTKQCLPALNSPDPSPAEPYLDIIP